MLSQPLSVPLLLSSLPERSREARGKEARGGRREKGGQRQEGGGGKPSARELGLLSVSALQSPAQISRSL